MKILYVTRHYNHSGYLILKKLIEQGVAIQAVVLHKDKSLPNSTVKRKFLNLIYYMKCLYYRCPPLKTLNSEVELIKKNKIPILWTNSIKSDDFYQSLSDLSPDIIVLGGGWHELLPKRVFQFPRLGCINTHPSLLPAFRGTSITRWQVLKGVKESGSTIHYVDETFDTGGVLAQKKMEVPNSMTPQDLFYHLGLLGAELMVDLLKKIERENAKVKSAEGEPQFNNLEYFKKWIWDLNALEIEWSKSFEKIHFKTLASTQESYEYKGVYFKHSGKVFFLRRSSLVKKNKITNTGKAGIYVDKIIGNYIYLTRDGEEENLVLETLQVFDSNYKIRRSHPANLLLKLKEGELFNYE